MKCKAIGRNMGRISIHGSGRGINGKWGTWGWEMSVGWKGAVTGRVAAWRKVGMRKSGRVRGVIT